MIRVTTQFISPGIQDIFYTMDFQMK